MKALKYIGIVVLAALMLFVFIGAKKSGKKELVFGMTVRDATPPYAQAMIYGADKAAKALGARVVVIDSQNDVLKQLEQMDSFISMKVDGLIFGGTIDTAAVIPGIKKFNEKRIPIMALDNAPEGGKVDLWISFDITESSKQAAEVFIDGIKKKHGKVPEGVVIEITGALGDAFTNECAAGFHSVVDQYKQLTVVQGEGKWDNINSFERTSDLLMRHKGKVVGIYVHTPDIMAPGVVQAIEQAGLKPADYFITGICMGPEGRDLIKEGKAYAIIGQPAMESGELAVRYLVDMAKGKAIPKIGDTVKKEGALWSPAQVLANPRCEGAFMRLQGPLVPFKIKPEDDRLWENQLTAKQ